MGRLEPAFVVENATEGVMEFLEDFDGHHDGVAATADIFGDFDDAAAVVFLEIEEELFPFGDDFLG